MASVYWMRSLVPIDRKFSRRMKIGSASAALVELLLRLADEAQGLLDLVHVREHRQQDPHLAVVRRAQDGAQLRQEHLRLGEAEADGAQAHGGIRLAAAVALAAERLVG